jgi:hypothetical protein
MNKTQNSMHGMCVSDLSSYESYPDITTRKVDNRFPLVFENIILQDPEHIFTEHKYEPFLGKLKFGKSGFHQMSTLLLLHLPMRFLRDLFRPNT